MADWRRKALAGVVGDTVFFGGCLDSNDGSVLALTSIFGRELSEIGEGCE